MFEILFHKCPEGYHYEFEKEFSSKFVRITLHHHRKYDFNLGKPVSTVWGFYNKKTGAFYSPVDSKKPGKMIDIHKTTPYSGMLKPTVTSIEG